MAEGKPNEESVVKSQEDTQLRPASSQASAAKKIEPKKEDELFEVMADQWGSAPAYKRGDLIRRSECSYDLDWALKMGSVRLAPEYAQSDLQSSTKPVENQDTDEK